MKYTLLAFLFFAALSSGQEQKHLTVPPANGARPADMTAFEIERGAQYPSTIHLKGSVEVRTPVCIPRGKRGKVICDGYMILRADEATYHEDTGEIEASGSVSVTPIFHEAKK